MDGIDFDQAFDILSALRRTFGAEVHLSLEGNGNWEEADAHLRLRALAGLGLAYVVQLLPAADWAGLARVAAASPMPVMLEESLSSVHAIDRMANDYVAPLAHLKLARLGGIDRVMAAGRRLQASRIEVMVGERKEGVVGTLASAHVAIALKASLREVCGADGLEGDPCQPETVYDRGRLHLPQGAGLGILSHPRPGGAEVLWEKFTA